VVVGDFDAAEVEKLARELFGAWKSPKPYAEVLQNWKQVETVNRTFETPDKKNAFFVAVTTMPMDQADPDYPPMILANSMMGGGLKSRLWLRIREKEGLSYQVQSGFGAGVLDKNAQFTALAGCNPDKVAKVESTFREEIARALEEGFPADEVETAKKAFLEERQLGRAQDGNLAAVLARNAQRGWTMARDAELERKIGALTPEQINAAFRRRISLAGISYFKAGDFRKAANP
jgi:zinc protease